MNYTVTYEMAPIAKILKDLGLDKDGDVQKQFTGIVNHRITKYMPFLTSVLSTKNKRVISPTAIEILGPYARYQYFGKVMVNAKTGKGPAFIPGIGFRFPYGSKLKATERDLEYDKSKNPRAGPFWDKRLVAAEGAQMVAEIQEYVKERGEKL